PAPREAKSVKEDFLLTRMAERATSEGHRLLYLQRAFYPVVEVEVQLIEKSREQMSDLERTVLGLCAQGLGVPGELAFAMGLKPHRFGPLLTEIEHRGLLTRGENGHYELAELGALSLQHGAEILRSRRSLLLCGVTGRPMPAPAYEAKRLEPHQLRRASRLQGLVPESATLSLRYLDLQAIHDKRAVNLPDEAIELEGIVADSVKSMFLQAVVEIAIDARGAEACRIHVGDMRGAIDWLSVQHAVGILEPLGFPHESPEAIVDRILGYLKAQGAVRVRGEIDPFGNPVINVDEGADNLLRHRMDERPLALSLGVGTFSPVPIHRLSLELGGAPRDVLAGRTLTAHARLGSAFAEKVHVLRVLRQADVQCRRTRVFGSARVALLREALSGAGIALEQAREVALAAELEELVAGL
ncbi:MAG TPA: hypothetical protein VK524_24650, partial [Polyangiaceae bacterium]|nr:hypothetical protein [Polyangiaceae bacterium]